MILSQIFLGLLKGRAIDFPVLFIGSFQRRGFLSFSVVQTTSVASLTVFVLFSLRIFDCFLEKCSEKNIFENSTFEVRNVSRLASILVEV